jgi:hypothetical protein
MSRLSLAVVLSAGSLLAQANAVPGTDIQMYELTDIGYQGRRGAAFPNGEAGFMVGHSLVQRRHRELPWMSHDGGVMVDTTRASPSCWRARAAAAWCRSSPRAQQALADAYNFSSARARRATPAAAPSSSSAAPTPTAAAPTASQYNLGPTTRSTRGSARGTRRAATSTAATHRSAARGDRLDPLADVAQMSAFEPVKNRIVVRESELVAGANYYARATRWQGEPMAARQQTSPTARCRSPARAAPGPRPLGHSMHGSVLTRWQGATEHRRQRQRRRPLPRRGEGHRPGGRHVHYEYAIHNLDNNRGARRSASRWRRARTWRTPASATSTPIR